jgi:2,3-bisphosphoglycerate-independent phosphoglycerate mutase
MANFDLMRRLALPEGGKIILLIMDGLGGLPVQAGGPTELEAATTPHLDRLAKEGSTGMIVPIARGIEPGSGPAHLALFGYDPLVYDIGRGALEAAGIGLDVNPGDIAARGNFCTVDEQGLIIDRRAGRIPTEKAVEAVKSLQEIKVPGVDITVQAVKEHRFALVLRGDNLDPRVYETDPLAVGNKPLPAKPEVDVPAAQHTADVINQWLAQVGEKLKNHGPANMVTLRGFATDPNLPKFQEIYKLNPACVAVYPMYKGVSRLVGMDIVETGSNDTPQDEFDRVAEIFPRHDYIFCHIKATDSRGEDGNFDAKVAVIEAVDKALPTLVDLEPQVLMVTGDHSTPAKLRSHSFHPVPLLIWAPITAMADNSTSFGERACMTGSLGIFPSADLMQMAMGHAGRLGRYGA